MRKPNDDVTARSVAERMIGDLIAPSTDGQVDDLARDLVSEFRAVEFETVTKKMGDEELHLRRLVLTGKWEIDPTGHGAK